MNYYSLLGIDDTADPETIKKAFRKKLKKHHPDIHHNKKTNDTVSHHHESLLDIINAYNILSNPIRRNQYDNNKQYQNEYTFEKHPKKIFNYETFLLKRIHIWEYKVKFFIYDLVYCDGEKAAQLYTRMQKQAQKQILQDALGYHDYFDCMFLLAEYYADKTDGERYIDKALELFLEIGIMENEKAYFKSYMEEVASMIFDILSKHSGEAYLNMNIVHQLLHSMRHWDITKQQKKYITQYAKRWENI